MSLLVERASAVVPGFSVTEENREAVAGLCQRLDGIPLAIELAAVRLRALSVHEVLDRLGERYGLLQTASPAALPRQQTLRALMDWSFDLLSKEEQVLWARLSIFAGGFELSAAEEVCSDSSLPRDSIATLLTDLVDKSIVIRYDSGPTVRHRLLETISQYGYDRLLEFGEVAELRRRHREWFANLLDQALRQMYGPRRAAWCDRFRAEQANMRAVLQGCLDDPDLAGQGLSMTTDLEFFWLVHGTLREGRLWLQRFLTADSTPGLDRIRALTMSAHVSVLQGRPDEARPVLAESRRLAERHGDAATLARIALNEGMVEVGSGRLELGIELTSQALVALRGTGDLLGAAAALIQLAVVSILHSDYSRADAYCREVLEVSEAHQEAWWAAFALWVQGLAAWFQRDLRLAGELERQSIRLREPFKDTWGIVFSLEPLAWIAAAEGQYELSAQLLGALHTIWNSIGGSLAPPLGTQHDLCAAQVRQALGDKAFEIAHGEGERLPRHEVLRLALGEAHPDQAREQQAAEPTPLTRRENEIAQLISEGLSNKEIAARLVIAQRTAEGHVEHILAKLGFTSRTQVAAWVTRHGPQGSLPTDSAQ